MRVVGTDVVLLLHIYIYIYIYIYIIYIYIYAAAGDAHEQAVMKKRVSSEFMCLCRLRFRVGGLALGLSSIGSSYRSNEDSAAASHSRCGQHRQQQPVAE